MKKRAKKEIKLGNKIDWQQLTPQSFDGKRITKEQLIMDELGHFPSMTNKEKFLLLVSDEKSTIIEDIKRRRKWRWLIRIKNEIHLQYLSLRDKYK